MIYVDKLLWCFWEVIYTEETLSKSDKLHLSFILQSFSKFEFWYLLWISFDCFTNILHLLIVSENCLKSNVSHQSRERKSSELRTYPITKNRSWVNIQWHSFWLTELVTVRYKDWTIKNQNRNQTKSNIFGLVEFLFGLVLVLVWDIPNRINLFGLNTSWITKSNQTPLYLAG